MILEWIVFNHSNQTNPINYIQSNQLTPTNHKPPKNHKSQNQFALSQNNLSSILLFLISYRSKGHFTSFSFHSYGLVISFGTSTYLLLRLIPRCWSISMYPLLDWRLVVGVVRGLELGLIDCRDPLLIDLSDRILSITFFVAMFSFNCKGLCNYNHTNDFISFDVFFLPFNFSASVFFTNDTFMWFSSILHT